MHEERQCKDHQSDEIAIEIEQGLSPLVFGPSLDVVENQAGDHQGTRRSQNNHVGHLFLRHNRQQQQSQEQPRKSGDVKPLGPQAGIPIGQHQSRQRENRPDAHLGEEPPIIEPRTGVSTHPGFHLIGQCGLDGIRIAGEKISIPPSKGGEENHDEQCQRQPSARHVGTAVIGHDHQERQEHGVEGDRTIAEKRQSHHQS